MSTHHNSIRKYTAALLDLFNNTEIQYPSSTGNIITKNIPIVYSTREKSRILEGHTAEQLASGNTNVLPRANLSLSTLVKTESRITNKNLKVNTVSSETKFEYMYNSVPYEFTYELTFMCRGMNEAAMIIEQIAPKFNPTINIDIWDGINLSEPTRIPVRLLDIGIEAEEYEEFSSNIIILSFGLSLMGNLYPPIRTIERIKEFKIFINEHQDQLFDRRSILGWDVNDSGELVNPTTAPVSDTLTYIPTLVDIVGNNVIAGDNNIYVIFEDKDNKITELSFDWEILSGSASIVGDLDKAILTVTGAGNIEVQVTITDPFGNFASISKIFTV